MRASLRGRFSFALFVSIVASAAASGYILHKFRSYEDAASRVMSGDQRSVLQGQLLEARIRGAIEFAQSLPGGEEAAAAMHDRLKAIENELKALSREHPHKMLEEAKKQISQLLSAKPESLEDLFVHYRNLKTTAFNTYRIAWANKWMTVAHNVGLVMNDLDNLPYHAGEKAVAGVSAKTAPLVSIITRSPLAQSDKLLLFGHLGTLKSQVAQYLETSQKGEKIRAGRVEALKRVANAMAKFNESRGKTMMAFSDEARTEVFKAIMAFGCFLLFAMGWYAFAVRRFSKHVGSTAAHLASQFKSWISPGGNLATGGFTRPKNADVEFTEAYQEIDRAMRRIGVLRKEDVLVKRLLNVPFVLVNRNKQAIYWNSALSILARVRALEESGPVPYANILRFTTAQGKVVDPVDKAFTENKEVSQLALLRLTDDGLAVHAVCTPVQGNDHQVEYVMVHMRDLREENRRAENELDRQLEIIRTAIEFVRVGKAPPDAGPGLRRPVLDALATLKSHAVELQEKSSVQSGQLETMRARMAREGDLKKAVHQRMEQACGEIAALRSQLAALRAGTNSMVAHGANLDGRGRLLKTEYEEIRKSSRDLLSGLKKASSVISACLERLRRTEELSSAARASERVIRSILDKAKVLNANNSILGSKRDLTPGDAIAITENIAQLMDQLDRSYGFIERSVSDAEREFAELTSQLRQNLAHCAKLSADDRGLASMVTQSERLVTASSEEVAELAGASLALKNSADQIEGRIQSLESKILRLTQIAQASIALQNQLEMGFRGMFESAAVSQVSIGSSREVEASGL